MVHSISQTLVHLVMQHPSAPDLLRDAGLDFWARGRRSVAEACEEAGVDPQRLLQEIHDQDRRTDPLPRWDLRPLRELVDYLETVEHPRLLRALGEVRRRARSMVSTADGAAGGQRLVVLLDELALDLTSHAEKEEEILYPLILEGHAARARESIHAMEVEHDDQMQILAQIRAGLLECQRGDDENEDRWSSLARRLGALEALLTDHIHLENNILFPRGFFEGRSS